MKLACITPIDSIDGLKDLLESFAEVFYCIGNKDKIIELIKSNQCNAIYTNPNMQGFVIDKDILDLGVEVVCTASTGLNHIDVLYCKEKSVDVISLTTDYDTINRIPATAEHAFALTTSLVRKVPWSFDDVKAGNWNWKPYQGRQLRDLRFGVLGYGRLGKMYAHFASAFSSLPVAVCDPYLSDNENFLLYHTGLKYKVGIDELFNACDVVSVHVHLNQETRHIVNKSLFKKPIYLINTSRGDVVKEDDVIDSLKSGKLLGYATDVLSDELGDMTDNEMVKASMELDNLLITPHIGGMTDESRHTAYTRVAEVLKDWR